MSAEEIDAAVRRVAARRPALAAAARAAADALTAGGGAGAIHQAALQEFLWWQLPRRYPKGDWAGLADAVTELLEELGLGRLAGVARSSQTAAVLAAWDDGPEPGARAFRSAHQSSGVAPPDTALLAWGTVMGSDEAGAYDAVGRALGEAIASGGLELGASRWRVAAAAVTEEALTRPLENPPGQTYVGLVTTERVSHWIDSAGHAALQAWRAKVANRLLNPIEPPLEPAHAVAPFCWLLERAAVAGGAELTQSTYLARATVLEAVERFGWWEWAKPPRSEADVHELATVRQAAARLRLVRRRGRRLHVTAKGARALAQPAELWHAVALETEDGTAFSQVVTELVGLRLVAGPAEPDELAADLAPVLAAQGWRVGDGPLTRRDVAWAIWRPLRWWRLLAALDEIEPVWSETGRRLAPHTVALRADGERMVLAYLRHRAAGPRYRVTG